MNATIIETKKLSTGVVVRIQQRRGKWDVIVNSNGYAFHYIDKAVAEAKARNTFAMWTMECKVAA